MKEILTGASLAFGFKIVGTALNFIFNVIVARSLKAEGVGVFYLALTITTIISTISRLGLDNTVLRFTAVNAVEQNWAAIKGLYRKSLFLVVASSIFFILIVWLAAPWLAEHVFSESSLTRPLRWMIWMTFPHAIFWLHSEFLKGLKQIAISQFVQGVSLPFFALVGVFMFGFGTQSTIVGVTLSYLISAGITALIGYYCWQKNLPELKEVEGNFATGKLLRDSFPLFIVAIMNLVINWAAILFLGAWGSSSEVGVYSAALRTAMLTSFVLIAVNSIAAPKFAALHRQADFEGLGTTARHAAKLMTLCASPVLFAYLIWSRSIMGFFGEEFISGSALLIVLALGQFVNVATGSVGYLLMMSGNGVLMRNNVILAAVTNIILCCMLIPAYGAMGAAISTSVTITLMNIVSAYLVWTKMQILTLPWPKFLRINQEP